MKIILPPKRFIPAYLARMSSLAQKIGLYKVRGLDIVTIFAQTGDSGYIKYAEKMLVCANDVEVDVYLVDRLVRDVDEDSDGNLQIIEYIAGTPMESIKRVHFCRVPQCLVCLYAKNRKRRALLFPALKKLQEDNPSVRFIFATFTQKHCPLSQLRLQIDAMNAGWGKFSRRKAFPGIGYLRATEVTFSKTQFLGQEIMAHPHSHVIIAVPSNYFIGRNYLSQDKWQNMWRDCMNLAYDPIVHVQAAYSKSKGVFSSEDVALEACKYITKFDDLIDFGQSLPLYSTQVRGLKTFVSGGLIRQYVSQQKLDSIEEKIETGDEERINAEYSFRVFWDDVYRKMRRASDGRFVHEGYVCGDTQAKKEADDFLKRRGIVPPAQPVVDSSWFDDLNELVL